jgi:hypothetical protein
MVGKRLVTLIGAAVCAVTVSACGAGEHARYSDNLGPGYVQLQQLYYQIQISRELNPWDVHEDKWYLQGYTPSQLSLPPTEEFFGVSLQVFNWTKQAHTPTDDFYISDTIGERFVPMRNPSPNPYTYVPVSIGRGNQLPTIDSAAYAGWTQGEMLVFKVPIASLVNRPFVLHIVDPADSSDQSQIELDV